MKKLLNLTSLFLACRLVWFWFQTCGTDLGMGESLPFCLACSPLATAVRMLLLGLVVISIYFLLSNPPAETPLVEDETSPVKMLRIHWHRIMLLIALLTYPIWINWIDINTIIPGPQSLFFTKGSCFNDNIKGTFLWGINMLFIAISSRILHKTEENSYEKEKQV